ncbi:GGDEF domain-containing protein [Undibacterium jejuense]|uniref:diguanylate cyclase n=2 Tax=Undibacterium jejuense TaxID=1344949 RepID=A0A923KR49_9BURK|nr:GGDEF domain-containing protein [Undibacterium jejuense]
MEQLMYFKNTEYRIEDIHLFRDLDQENLALSHDIIKDCPVVKACKGQVVLDANSSGSRLFIVLHGALGITKLNEDNNHIENSITQYLPGECVGEISVLDEEIHSATISALSDSELLVIEADILWRLIDELNGVARNLLQLLSFRIRAANAQIRSRQKVGEFYRQLSMVDGLTGLHNRAWLNAQLPGLIENAHATGNALSIIMVDLDHFKRFNDEHGHLLGDDALQTAAKVLNAGLRPTDFAARYGGEEMMVILPGTAQKAAIGVAQRLCTKLSKTRVFLDNRKPLPHITGSFGVATLEPGMDSAQLMTAADTALYRAKDGGRNQVAL